MSGDEECVKVDPTHPAFINTVITIGSRERMPAWFRLDQPFPIGLATIGPAGLSEDQLSADQQLSEDRRELYIFR